METCNCCCRHITDHTTSCITIQPSVGDIRFKCDRFRQRQDLAPHMVEVELNVPVEVLSSHRIDISNDLDTLVAAACCILCIQDETSCIVGAELILDLIST